VLAGEQQSVGTPHAARGRVHPPCRHSKTQILLTLTHAPQATSTYLTPPANTDEVGWTIFLDVSVMFLGAGLWRAELATRATQLQVRWHPTFPLYLRPTSLGLHTTERRRALLVDEGGSPRELSGTRRE
jgi:hypothetical protein